VPSGSGAASVDHAPPAPRDAVSVWSGAPAALIPLNNDTVTVLESEGEVPALPEICGVVSAVAEPFAGDAIVTAGASPSTTLNDATPSPTLSAESRCDTRRL
jgi:hypothetical protein